MVEKLPSTVDMCADPTGIDENDKESDEEKEKIGIGDYAGQQAQSSINRATVSQ